MIKDDTLWQSNITLEKSRIEIVDFAINMVISHSFFFVCFPDKRHSTPRTVLFTRPTEELGAPAYRKFDMEVPSWLPFVESEFPFFIWGNLGKLRPVIGAAWFV